MTNLIQNLGIYFPVQIWKYSSLPIYRFEPPRIGTLTTWEFNPHFLDPFPDCSPKLKEAWKKITTIWGFNPKYLYSLTRGFNFITIFQNPSPPYNTNFMMPFGNEDFSRYGNFDSIWSFGFYNYSVPDTTLLFLSLGVGIHQYKLLDMVLVNENGENDSSNNQYNFLPFQKNKDIPFTNVFFFDRHMFLYIFESKPSQPYWRANTEGICIPSHDPKDYHTAVECVKQNLTIFPNSIYVESNNAPLIEILKPEKPPLESQTIFFILLLIVWIVSLLFWIYVYIKTRSTTIPVHKTR